ncbi:MAG: hypothetical protein JNM18_10370 [Planctomycetaceae bacterium]|nr:hypothetical protein [Planctomycetaceae bacterium]
MSHCTVSDSSAHLRRGVYLLLIALAVGNLTGRLLAVNSIDTIRLEKQLNDEEKKKPVAEQKIRNLQRPFLSGNDRSRWCTVRALVEYGTYAIDDVIQQPNWDTIDMVKHDGQGNPATGPDEGHCYSSKPPLLATLMAGEYWLLHKLTGHTLLTHPYELGRVLLFTWNVLPFALYLVILARIVERYGRSDWGRIFVVAVGALGTLLTTYATVFTNHWPGALAAMIALDATLRILYEDERRLRWFFVAGVSAAFMATCELPALSFFGLVGLLLLWKSPRATLLAGVPGVLIVAAAALGTNYAAHGTIRPAYSERHTVGGWYDYQYRRGERVIDSYWKPTTAKSKIDQGEASIPNYAFHVLVGHHGIFSLTPVWILSLIGLGLMVTPRDSTTADTRAIAAAILLCTVVCLVFYVTRPLEDRNYGGTATGFRWAMWMAPLWLFGMLPTVDAMSHCRYRRGLASLLLTISVISVSYPIWNPWTLPWLQVFWEYLFGVS